MKYQIVKDLEGEVICYGPNDGMYEPILQEGQTLELLDEKDAKPIIKSFSDKTKAEADAKIASRESALAKLAELGLTEEEVGAL